MKKSVWLICLICFFVCCGTDSTIQKLKVEDGKRFEGINIEKIWEGELYGRLVLALPQGILLDEIQDKVGNEHKLMLFDYNGNLIKEKILVSGEGPNEVTVITLENVWLSPSGKIICQDNNYLKTIDPETFEIQTLEKISNVVKGYGHEYTFGRQTPTCFEERDGRTVTTLESTGFFENLTYYIASYENVLENFSIICKTKKPMPFSWEKLMERKGESYTDYYYLSKIKRIFSVDWNREDVYFIPDIEKPEINFVNLNTKQEGRHIIDIDNTKFSVDQRELEFYHEYVSSQTSSELKSYYKQILHIPPNAPALMELKVVKDRLIIITGNRDWDKQENEALVYSLPSLEFEGSFSIPYPNIFRTKWYDDYFIMQKLVKRNDDFFYYWEVYQIEMN